MKKFKLILLRLLPTKTVLVLFTLLFLLEISVVRADGFNAGEASFMRLDVSERCIEGKKYLKELKATKMNCREAVNCKKWILDTYQFFSDNCVKINKFLSEVEASVKDCSPRGSCVLGKVEKSKAARMVKEMRKFKERELMKESPCDPIATSLEKEEYGQCEQKNIFLLLNANQKLMRFLSGQFSYLNQLNDL